MGKYSVFIAISLDGYIARANGDIAWLDSAAPAIEGEDYGFNNYFSSVDSMVMGRKTFETAINFAEWPYAGKRVVVLSHSYIEIPDRIAASVESMSGAPVEVAQKLESTGAKHVYVDGGQTIQGFLRAGLINEMTITSIPILLGSGLPLFGVLDQDIRLHLMESRAFSNGFVQSKYQVIPTK
jgi:dihydrofolate reductase